LGTDAHLVAGGVTKVTLYAPAWELQINNRVSLGALFWSRVVLFLRMTRVSRHAIREHREKNDFNVIACSALGARQDLEASRQTDRHIPEDQLSQSGTSRLCGHHQPFRRSYHLFFLNARSSVSIRLCCDCAKRDIRLLEGRVPLPPGILREYFEWI